MQYISAEEFLKQDKEVQKVFLDWWKPSIGDLYCIKQRINLFDDTTQQILQTVSFNYDESSKNLMLGFNFIAPLFTEGQLRKFIEDKKCGKVDITYDNEDGCAIGLTDKTGLYSDLYNHLDKDLFKAYWEVAVHIAKEEYTNVKSGSES